MSPRRASRRGTLRKRRRPAPGAYLAGYQPSFNDAASTSGAFLEIQSRTKTCLFSYAIYHKEQTNKETHTHTH